MENPSQPLERIMSLLYIIVIQVYIFKEVSHSEELTTKFHH